MKKLENKTTEIEALIEEGNQYSGVKKMLYSDLIIAALKSPRQEGYNYDELKSRFRIIDIMEPSKEGDIIELEDSDAAFLQPIMKNFPWRAVDKDLITMTDDILAMKSVTKK